MEPLRFIHTADLHLDSPFKGMSGLPKDRLKEVRDSTFTAFDRLIAYAVEKRPDFVLIAGDVYDGEDRSIRAQHRFHTGMQRLNEYGIPVFLSHGNHDHLSGKWARFELPSNVYVFGEKVEQKELSVKGMRVKITGFSYSERHVTESMIEQYPSGEDRSAVHIGMLHGSMEGDSSHAVYAPFRKEQLLSKNYDYWALGHIHLRSVLHQDPPVVYPGNLQGRHRKESGPKGFYEVTLTKEEVSLTFVPVSVVEFGTVSVRCSGLRHTNELLQACSEALRQFQETKGSGIVDLRLTGLDRNLTGWLTGSAFSELQEAIREEAETSDPFIWVDRLYTDEALSDEEPSALGLSVIQQMESWQTDEWKDVLQDVYRHVKGSRFLEPLTEQLIDELRQEAIMKIKQELRAGE